MRFIHRNIVFSQKRNIVRNSTLMVYITAILLVSSFSISNLFLLANNQVYATLGDSNSKMIDLIKKACPNYEGNGDIKGLVSDILKACLHQRDTSQPPTNPNPYTSPLDQNILQVYVTDAARDTSITVKTTDLITQKASITNFFDGGTSDEYYVIPVGDRYAVEITGDPDFDSTQVKFNSSDCTPFLSEASALCTGTMGDSMQYVGIEIVGLEQQ